MFLYEDSIRACDVCGRYSVIVDTFVGLIAKMNYFIIVFTLL